MRRESIGFWENDPGVSLEAYIPESEGKKPAVVVLPGGAYFALSGTEGGAVARYFAQKGFAAFLLRYSTMHPSFDMPCTEPNPHTVFPELLHELAAAINLIRENADEWNVLSDSISLVGFSAGGHLAANYCNEWAKGEISSALSLPMERIRPNACVLSYAATRLRRSSATMNMAVFGKLESYPEELLKRWCAAENVNRNTPPTFLWHTITDTMVPVAQSYEMAAALAEEGIPHELHIFSEGEHATGLAEGLPAEPWKELAINFIKRYT